MNMEKSLVCTKEDLAEEDLAEEDYAMDDWAPTPFLEWPGEIRNRVYEFYAAGITSLGISRDGTASAPPLMQVNRQVRREMSKLVSHELASTAVSFDAVAAGFNFDHILRFLQRLKSDPAAPVRDLNIAVKFTRYCIDQQEIDDLFQFIDAPTHVWRSYERHPTETDDEYAARYSQNSSCASIFEIHGQSYRIRVKHTTSAIKLRLATESGSLQPCEDLFYDRMLLEVPHGPALSMAVLFYMAILPLRPCPFYLRPISVNYAGFRGVSKERRLCAKYEGKRVLLKDTFVRTSRPRPRSEALLRWQNKKRSERVDVTLAKLTRTLSLHDGGKAHWEAQDLASVVGSKS